MSVSARWNHPNQSSQKKFDGQLNFLEPAKFEFPAKTQISTTG